MRPFRPRSRAAVVALGCGVVLCIGGVVVAATQVGSGGRPGATTVSGSGVAPVAAISVEGINWRGRVPWNRRMTLTITDGRFRTVTVTTAHGASLPGTLSADETTWTSSTRLVPRTHSLADVDYADDAAHHLR